MLSFKSAILRFYIIFIEKPGVLFQIEPQLTSNTYVIILSSCYHVLATKTGTLSAVC